MNGPALKLPSFAKINWTLRVLGRRADGYHQIDTVLQTVSLHDDLTFTPRDDTKVVVHCDAPGVPTDETNLAVRAAYALREAAKVAHGVDIHLRKRVPSQAGLGGASSNAAVTLLALNQLWRTRIDIEELIMIGRALGSDVPFFFTGGVARATGTGTTISPLSDGAKQLLLIVTPGVSVSTPLAYQALNSPSLTTTGSTSILSSSFTEPFLSDSNQWAPYNDFEGVIFEIEPEIKRAKQALLDAGAQGGLLAGSGSSVFGIFENEDAREQALAVLKCETGWQTFSCETVSRQEYSKALSSSGCSLLRSLNFQTDTGA